MFLEKTQHLESFFRKSLPTMPLLFFYSFHCLLPPFTVTHHKCTQSLLIHRDCKFLCFFFFFLSFQISKPYYLITSSSKFHGQKFWTQYTFFTSSSDISRLIFWLTVHMNQTVPKFVVTTEMLVLVDSQRNNPKCIFFVKKYYKLDVDLQNYLE